MSEIIASSEDWVFLCDAQAVPEGEIGTANHPGGMALAICNVGGEFFVFADRCSHGAASFYEEGELDGHVLECGWHNGTFDARTGEALTMPCRTPLRRFDAKVSDGGLFINPKVMRFEKAAD